MAELKGIKDKLGGAMRLLAIAAGVALRAGARWSMAALRAFGKVILTVWRMAAALDSALWRAVKLIVRNSLDGVIYAAGILAVAFRGLLLWLPTRWGRAYSAISGVVLVIASLWIVDELRAGPELDASSAATLRPPVDESDPILARIEGRYVHLSEIESAARAGGFLRPGERLTPETAFARELVEAYVEQRLLAQAARDEGLHRTPAIARRINAARDRVLAASYMESRIDSAVTPQSVEQLYKAQAGVTALGDEVRARHIVVATGEEAEEIVTLLTGGADFGALARKRSIDRATAPYGGEIGWFTRAMMAPAFANAAFSAEVGKIAPPFQTEFGWHVLEVTDRRSTSAVPFTEVKNSIESFLRMRTIDATLRGLEDERQVIYFRPEENETEPLPPPELSPPELRESRGTSGGGRSPE